MLRRSFLKWLGIVPVCAGLGLKIPWPKTDVLTVEMVNEAIRKADAIKPLSYQDAFGEKTAKIMYGPGPIKFNHKNYGVVTVNTYKS